MVIAHEPAQPTEFDSTMAWKAGRLATRWYCHMYSVEPMMNPPSVKTIVVCPEPTANSVPEAHDPPICIPMPNRNAPISRATPSGPPDGVGVLPKSPTPDAMIRATKVAAVPSSSACARMPLPLPTDSSSRNAEVNP